MPRAGEKGKVKMENGGPAAVTMPAKKIKDFADLETWKLARLLRGMRRAAVSVTANLAEGHGRFSYQENLQFCRQSRGSVYELRDHLITALDEGYISRQEYEEGEATALGVIRLLNGYIRATQKLKESSRSTRSQS